MLGYTIWAHKRMDHRAIHTLGYNIWAHKRMDHPYVGIHYLGPQKNGPSIRWDTISGPTKEWTIHTLGYTIWAHKRMDHRAIHTLGYNIWAHKRMGHPYVGIQYLGPQKNGPSIRWGTLSAPTKEWTIHTFGYTIWTLKIMDHPYFGIHYLGIQNNGPDWIGWWGRTIFYAKQEHCIYLDELCVFVIFHFFS